MTLFNGTLPSFDFDEGALWATLARCLFLVGLFVSYGALLYRARLAPAVLRLMPGKSGEGLYRRHRQRAQAGLYTAIVTACLWLTAQAWLFFSTHGIVSLFKAVAETAISTSFGHIWILQTIAIIAALGCVLAAKRNAIFHDIAAACAGIAVMLQVGHDHAASMYDGFSFLLVSEVAHLLAGAAWLGGLLPLLITVRFASPSVAHAAARRFSPYSTACVVVLSATAIFQGWQLVGSVPGLIGTAYGWMAILKILLFLVLLGFAACNRYRLTPRLVRSNGDPAKTTLIRSIGLETGFGLAILVAASILVSLPPSIHEQPVWPFTTKFSLVTVLEEPAFFSEVILASFALTLAFAILAAGLYFRRARWPAIIAAIAIAWFAIPHLSLLFVEAYPTSFYHSTTNFAATSIAKGGTLYPQQCASCHGAQGRGDGPLAAKLPVPPADLTAGHLWAHSDGELFWWLTDGIKAPDGQQAMPPFRDVLSQEERWNVIDFIRARNEGLTYADTGNWSPNIQAPKFQADCKSGTVTSDDLKGRVVRLVFGGAMPPTKVANDVEDRLATVLATTDNLPVDETHCLAKDPSLVTAYSRISGIPADKLPGTEFLIDTNGWLRAIQKPGQTISWDDPGKLEVSVIELCKHPLADNPATHAHHH